MPYCTYCVLCNDAVIPVERREHLEMHHPGARHFTAKEVDEFFESRRICREDSSLV